MATPNSPSSPYRDRMEQAGQNAGRKLGDVMDRAQDAATSAAGQVQDKAEGVVQRAQDLASNVGQTVKDAASTVANKAEHAYESTSQNLGEFQHDVARFISRYPKQSVAIGFGIGFLVGTVLVGGAFAGGRRA